MVGMASGQEPLLLLLWLKYLDKEDVFLVNIE